MKKKFLTVLFVVVIFCLLAISVSAANEVTLVGGETADFATVFKINSSNQVTGFNTGYTKDDITDVIFPDEIVGIEANVLFYEAANLNSLTFAATDTFFISGDGIFTGCSVKTITFNPDCVVEIRKGNFSSCASLTKITFPKFSKLASGSFQSCSNMVNTNELVLVEGMTEIGGHAFNGCLKLTGTVVFPSTLETIQEFSFQETGFNGFDLSKCSKLTKVGGGYGGPFNNCDSITSLDLSGCTSLTALKKSFAQGCDNLTEVILPPKLTEIPYKAFAHCYKLQSIVLPASCTYVADEAFHSARSGQDIKTFTVYLQSAVKFHSEYPFRDSGAKIEFVLLNGVTAKQLKAVDSTWTQIASATVVDYLAEDSKWTYKVGQNISSHTIIENYCTTLALTKSHTATDNICANDDKCTSCAYPTLASHTGKVTISYPNGYDEAGEKRACHLESCGNYKPTEVKPIFETRGYSIKENNGFGILSTYMVNPDELREYESANEKLTVGIIIVNADFEGQSEFMSKNEDGKYSLNSTRGVQAEIPMNDYSRIDARIDQFTQNEATLNLILALYVVDENGVSYVQHDGTYEGEVTKGDVTLDVVTITKIAELTNVTLPFVVPTQASEIKESL